MSTKLSDRELNIAMNRQLISIDALLKLRDDKDRLELMKRSRCNDTELMMVENSISYYTKIMLRMT